MIVKSKVSEQSFTSVTEAGGDNSGLIFAKIPSYDKVIGRYL